MVVYRRSIKSKARAVELVERIAAKHCVSVRVLMCARWDRYAVAARAELVFHLIDDFGWSQRAVAAFIGFTQSNVRKLYSAHKMHAAQIARIRGVAKPPDPEGRIRDLEEELERLSGTRLCERLARDLGLRMRWAIELAILAEAYPRVVRLQVMLQLYDEACAHLNYGIAHEGEGATYQLIAKNTSQLNRYFVEQGWPAPAGAEDGRGARRLSDDAALWLSDTCGAPRRSIVLGVREGVAIRKSNSPSILVDGFT